MVVGDITTGTEVLVIGGGPAGYVAAIRAGQLDLDITLVEMNAFGGTCLNHGCIPSKALISATNIAAVAREGEAMGIHADPAIDVSRMIGWKDDVVDQLTNGVEKLCKANGVTLVEGMAEFVDENTVRVSHQGEGRGAETISFENAIIASGSRPIELPGFEYKSDFIINSREALALESAPESMLIVGAGYIGLELAGVFAKVGTSVQVVEMLDTVLPGYESDLVRPVQKRAEDLGIGFYLERIATDYREEGNHVIVSTESTGNDGSNDAVEFDVESVLVAVGREPVTDTLNLDAIGLHPNDNGFIETDSEARTDVDHIFAVGDVAGEPMLAHKGMVEGRVAASVIAGSPAALDYQAIPAAVFTEPEIATVGMTEQEADADGFDPVVGRFPFRASGRALTTGQTDGFVRIIADESTGFVLGGQIVGPEASELIAEIGLAIELGSTLEDICGTIHTHPTLAESVLEAAENALGQAIHSLNR